MLSGSQDSIKNMMALFHQFAAFLKVLATRAGVGFKGRVPDA